MAKFVLCDFNANLNKVRLDRSTIETWMSTIVNKPLVGKIVKNFVTNTEDFSGHNMKVVAMADGSKRVEFDTNAYGSFTSVDIEEIDGVESLVATAEIWPRYPKVIELIADRVQNSTLNSSWEISVSDSYMDGDIKVIKSGQFEAHCLLGKDHTPAFACSRLLEVAEDENGYDEEIAEAALYEMVDASEVTMKNKEEIIAEEQQPETEQIQAEEQQSETEQAQHEEIIDQSETEVSALTDNDIRRAIERQLEDGYPDFMFPEEHIVWVHSWKLKNTEFYEIPYSVDGETVTLGDKTLVELVASPKSVNQMMSERDDAIATANQKIQELQATVDELMPYKEAHDKEVAEREAAELQQKKEALKAYALKSGHITEQEISENENIAGMIEAVNEAGIKQLIAERFMASLSEETEVSEAVPVAAKATIETEETTNKASIAMMFANKKKN